LNVKKCICWCLSIIELKNAQWNIEKQYWVFIVKIYEYFGMQRGYAYTYKLVKNTVCKSEIIYFDGLELWGHEWKTEHTQNQHRYINNKFFRYIWHTLRTVKTVYSTCTTVNNKKYDHKGLYGTTI